MRRRARSFLPEPSVRELAISQVGMVVAILLIIIATAIPNLLLAAIADAESRAVSSQAWAKFLR